jgi:hypothetical protein
LPSAIERIEQAEPSGRRANIGTLSCPFQCNQHNSFCVLCNEICQRISMSKLYM